MARDLQPTFMERLANRRPPYFWWLLAILLASCFSVLCWSLCISIFNHPEVPRNYEMMRKLGRLPEHKAYTSQTAPKHPASSAPTLRKSHLAFNSDELEIINRSLLHSYLTDFRESTFCTYLTGDYQVTGSRQLTQDDIISDGFALQLRAFTQPNEYSDATPYPVIAEIIFPTPYPESHKGFHQGDMLELGITPQFASLLHVGKIEQADDDTIVVVTAVSLASRLRPPHEGPFDLVPPKQLNLGATFPLFTKEK
ncbi:MAG: hypothetical protein KJO21_13010 [Verrucomicrobiae bacterium]|nr:hypothetical protein [Verrucomicrobiae bacterium]NNJ44226.1 hypothetical protein [Akkermansiaceae bacterium]